MEALLSKFGSGTDFDAKTSEMMLRFMSLLLRFAVEATFNELDVIKDNVGDMVRALNVYDATSAGNDATLDDTQYRNAKGSGSFLYLLSKRLYDYIEGMMSAVNKPTAERKIKSQSLVKSLNLSQFQRVALTQQQRANIETKRLRYTQQLRPPTGSRRGAMARTDTQEDEDRKEADEDERLPRGMRGREAQERKEAGEDGGDGRNQFSEDHRRNFGRNASAMAGFFGEEAVPANEAEVDETYANVNTAYSPAMFRTLEQVSSSQGRDARDLERRVLVERLRRRYGTALDVEDLEALSAPQRERELKNMVRSGVIPKDEGGALFVYELMGNESAVQRILDMTAPQVRALIRG
jgi:hypothetical protein